MKSGERKRWNKYRYIRSVFFFSQSVRFILKSESNAVRMFWIKFRFGSPDYKWMLELGRHRIKNAMRRSSLESRVRCRWMDTDIATCTYRVVRKLLPAFANMLLHFWISLVSIVLLLSWWYFIFTFHSWIYLDAMERHGKGKVYSGVCMKYEMIFKRFNIIPPISEMLTQSQHISHFSQNLSSHSFEVETFFFLLISISFCFISTMSIGCATRFARAQKTHTKMEKDFAQTKIYLLRQIEM